MISVKCFVNYKSDLKLNSLRDRAYIGLPWLTLDGIEQGHLMIDTIEWLGHWNKTTNYRKSNRIKDFYESIVVSGETRIWNLYLLEMSVVEIQSQTYAGRESQLLASYRFPGSDRNPVIKFLATFLLVEYRVLYVFVGYSDSFTINIHSLLCWPLVQFFWVIIR